MCVCRGDCEGGPECLNDEGEPLPGRLYPIHIEGMRCDPPCGHVLCEGGGLSAAALP